jgi:hypothetical protein
LHRGGKSRFGFMSILGTNRTIRCSIPTAPWSAVARRQGGDLLTAAGEESVGSDEEGIGALALKCGKGRIDLAARVGVEDIDLQPNDAGRFPHLLQCGLPARTHWPD